MKLVLTLSACAALLGVAVALSGPAVSPDVAARIEVNHGETADSAGVPLPAAWPLREAEAGLPEVPAVVRGSDERTSSTPGTDQGVAGLWPMAGRADGGDDGPGQGDVPELPEDIRLEVPPATEAPTVTPEAALARSAASTGTRFVADGPWRASWPPELWAAVEAIDRCESTSGQHPDTYRLDTVHGGRMQIARTVWAAYFEREHGWPWEQVVRDDETQFAAAYVIYQRAGSFRPWPHCARGYY